MAAGVAAEPERAVVERAQPQLAHKQDQSYQVEEVVVDSGEGLDKASALLTVALQATPSCSRESPVPAISEVEGQPSPDKAVVGRAQPQRAHKSDHSHQVEEVVVDSSEGPLNRASALFKVV